MNHCRSIRKEFAAYLGGELEPGARADIKSHLEACQDCRRELAGVERVFRGAGSLAPELERELESVDWNARAGGITAAVWAARPRVAPEASRPGLRLFAPGFRPVLAGLVLGIMVGTAATFLIFRGVLDRRLAGDRYFAPPEFLDRVDLEIARRDTLDYLDKSQYLLLEIAGPDAGGNGSAAEKARELLARKKFLNPELEKTQMAGAKAICDQIELLFYQLAQISSGLSDVQRSEIRKLIREKDLFLKIRLLKREIQESEA
jgi:hypothetical protein